MRAGSGPLEPPPSRQQGHSDRRPPVELGRALPPWPGRSQWSRHWPPVSLICRRRRQDGQRERCRRTATTAPAWRRAWTRMAGRWGRAPASPPARAWSGTAWNRQCSRRSRTSVARRAWPANPSAPRAQGPGTRPSPPHRSPLRAAPAAPEAAAALALEAARMLVACSAPWAGKAGASKAAAPAVWPARRRSSPRAARVRSACPAVGPAAGPALAGHRPARPAGRAFPAGWMVPAGQTASVGATGPGSLPAQSHRPVPTHWPAQSHRAGPTHWPAQSHRAAQSHPSAAGFRAGPGHRPGPTHHRSHSPRLARPPRLGRQARERAWPRRGAGGGGPGRGRWPGARPCWSPAARAASVP